MSNHPPYFSVFSPPPPQAARERWGRLYGNAQSLALSALGRQLKRFMLVVVPDSAQVQRVERELRFFNGSDGPEVLAFPDWETLPYDVFSPYQDIVSDRLTTLARLPDLHSGMLVVPVSTLMQRLCPVTYVAGHSMLISAGDQLDLDATRQRLERAGYRAVSQVQEHGEYAVRGALLDLFPMGSSQPLRIDLFDDEVESIRVFDPESQRSVEKLHTIKLLPAREFPLTEEAISGFRSAFRAAFSGDPQRSLIYREISEGRCPGGIEYYLPLFFPETAELFDYLPDDCLIVTLDEATEAAAAFEQSVQERYAQRRHDTERPLLEPERLFLTAGALAERIGSRQLIEFSGRELPPKKHRANFATAAAPPLYFHARAEDPAAALKEFLAKAEGQVLFTAESAGRRETLAGMLKDHGIVVRMVNGWADFLASKHSPCITVAPLESGLVLEEPALRVIAETQLLGERALQTRRRRAKKTDPDAVVRNLTELVPGDPVVHEEHGVGRYVGLQVLDVGGFSEEFVTINYAGEDKLYVPVASLHLISRYTGVAPDAAPLHRLGGDRWQKIKEKAARKARDVAAELLDVYARRAAIKGHAFEFLPTEYRAFAEEFPFEETPDQAQAIEQVIADMRSDRTMDRVVCGDVGFGKTEVALRASHVAVLGGKQVAVLVPTTLLAQQHFENFRDRFAEWPVRVEVLSRFNTAKGQQGSLNGLADGSVDIVIGTHKLLQKEVKFKNLGLVVVDEEHRFGVRDKERLKSLRSEVDILTLTATPIPRTLNMSLAGIRDLSIIATPPARRLAVKTFVSTWNEALVREACERELKRGGQIYFLHNDVATIEQKAEELRNLVPGSRVEFAHGQMRERALERVMLDFYHQRFNILVCTTIVESGIDVPNANTIIINRADRFGLAQLHQLRGRVGRSHHRAYAYLIVPDNRSMTADARKRLDALESLEDLGAGFMLATHDLEIRGAGELLGSEQSGQIQEIGFTLYSDLLHRAVAALKSGKSGTDLPLDHAVTEVDLRTPALIPDDYLPDVQQRLVLYKRIASAADSEGLRELQVEMIDRFGLLPPATKSLFALTGLKLQAAALGIRKLEAGPGGGRVLFDEQPRIDPLNIVLLLQSSPGVYAFDGAQKLTFKCDLDEPEERFDWVTNLLQRLAAGAPQAHLQ